MNKLSRAEVEVQPYAFTTKSLYVGHFDYNYMPWQIIDTPGILDTPLENRGTIEMTSITALAHLNAAIVYVMDISSQCGHSIEAQVNLYKNIKPFVANKPLRIMLNKCDILAYNDLPEEEKELIRSITEPSDFNERQVPVNYTSTVTGDGLMDLRNSICDELLAKRVDDKLRNKQGSAKSDLMDRLRVSIPEKRDEVERSFFVPKNFKPKKSSVPKDKDVLGPLPKQPYQEQDRFKPGYKKTERDLELEQDYDYLLNLQKNWMLENPDEKFDVIPEIINGKNIADYIDPEIMEKLAALEAEEEERGRTGYYDIDHSSDDEETQELRKLGSHIRDVKKKHMEVSRREKKIQAPQIDRRAKVPGNFNDLKKKMTKLGLDLEEHWDENKNKTGEDDMDVDAEDSINARSRARERINRKRARSKSLATLQAAEREKSMARSQSRPAPRDKSGVRDEAQQVTARKKMKKSFVKNNQLARRGEGDRHIPDLKPKHLLSGKRGIGKTDRR